MKSREMAFGAIYSAVSVILIAISSVLSNDLFFVMAASLPVMILSDQFGRKVAFLSYVVISAIAFLIFPLWISSMAFIIVFGPFAMLRSIFRGQKRMVFHFFMLLGLGTIFYLMINYLLKANLEYTLPYMFLTILMLLVYVLFCEYFTRWYKQILKKRF